MTNDTYNEKLLPSSEVENRIKRLRIEMKQEGIEAVLILYRPDYFYFSGTSQYSILYVPLEGEPILFVRRDVDRAREESPLSLIIPFQSPREIVGLIREHNGKTPSILGTELDVLPVRQYFRLRGIFNGVQIRDASPIIMKCRMKKTAFEIDQIRTAGQIAKEVFEAGRNLLRPGMSEIEFGALLELEAKKRGHEGIIRMRGLNYEGYSWHVLSGPSGSIVSEADTPSGGKGLSPAFPMGAGYRKIQHGEPILVDFPVCYNGYISDQTRVFCVGDLPEKFKKAYEFCRRVVARLAEEMRPGVKAEDLFLVAERMAQDNGYEEGFLGLMGKKAKFVGHGVGLEANEIPPLAPRQDYSIEAGAVLAIEPKVLFKGEGVVGIEDTFLIINQGCVKLTRISEEIIQI